MPLDPFHFNSEYRTSSKFSHMFYFLECCISKSIAKSRNTKMLSRQTKLIYSIMISIELLAVSNSSCIVREF